MPDLQEVLSKLKPQDAVEVDFDNYADASEFPPPVPEGIYTLVQGKPEFEVTKEGRLGAVMTQKIVDGPAPVSDAQRELRFDRVSDKPFLRSGVYVSMMADQLRAVGVFDHVRSPQDYANALLGAEGTQFHAFLKWDGYCAHKNTPHADEKPVSVKGAKNFDADGTAKCSVCGSDIRARARVDRRIPANAAGTNGNAR